MFIILDLMLAQIYFVESSCPNSQGGPEPVISANFPAKTVRLPHIYLHSSPK